MPFTSLSVPGKKDPYIIDSGDTISLGLRAVYPGVAVPVVMTIDYVINGSGTTFPGGATTLQHSHTLTQVASEDFQDSITLKNDGSMDRCSVTITGTIPGEPQQTDSINVHFNSSVVATALHPDLEAALVDRISAQVRKSLKPSSRKKS